MNIIAITQKTCLPRAMHISYELNLFSKIIQGVYIIDLKGKKSKIFCTISEKKVIGIRAPEKSAVIAYII